MLKVINLKIKGIHCASCKTLIETEIDVLPGVANVEVNHISEQARIEFDEAKISQKKIFRAIKKLNYEPSLKSEEDDGKESAEENSDWKQILLGLLIPLGLVGLVFGYFKIQKMGGFELLAKLNQGQVSYSIILLIGLLAGFHCVGMCGGLIVAYSSSQKSRPSSPLDKGRENSLKPHFQYNLGRFISYALIGGILGGAGAFFGVNPTFTGSIIIFAGFFMILMGLSFLTGSRILEKIKLKTPQFIARFLYNQKHAKNKKGPLAVGLLNGFMPCGPLQAIQLYALASGSFIKGASSMAIYALGTIPLMFGFGAFLSAISRKYIKQILKISGALVIVLGLIMLNRGLTSFGYGVNFGRGESGPEKAINQKQEFQEARMELGYFGYQPNTLYIKKGIPVRWIIDVKQMSGCVNSIMIESLGIKRDLRLGENIIEFTPPQGASQINFSCWMRMVWGKFIVQ